MCHLNVLISKDKNRERLANIYNSFGNGVASSYADNPDGAGVYCDGKITKSFDFVDMIDFKSLFMKKKAIITHQRIATSGYSVDGLHPFESERFVLIHNGILSHSRYNSMKNFSDTYAFNEHLIKYFKKNNNIIKTIKRLTNGETGSYSVIIYDKKINKYYYFKSKYTDIKICNINSSTLYITTSDKNLAFFNKYPVKEFKIKPYVLYEINPRDVSIVEIAKLYKPTYTYIPTKYYSAHGYYDESSYDKFEEAKSNTNAKELDELDELEMDKYIEGEVVDEVDIMKDRKVIIIDDPNTTKNYDDIVKNE